MQLATGLSAALILAVLGMPSLAWSQSTVARQPAAAPDAAELQRRQAALRMGTRPQEVLFTKITVADLHRSVDFYTKVIGLKLVTSPDITLAQPPPRGSAEQDYASATLNYSGSMADAMLVLIKRRGVVPTRDAASQVIVGIKVASTGTAMEAARRAGHAPTRPWRGRGSPGHIADPDGYGVELVQAGSFARQ
jgi:catechol 2,3-dioxygenase-like lactoylglutathione lyase family enzyme